MTCLRRCGINAWIRLPHANINVYPQRPDRAYAAYIDGGIIILDIADKAYPKMISRLDYHPPLPGSHIRCCRSSSVAC